jgi:hypothetical protein
MSDKLEKLKLNKLIQEYNYLMIDFEYKMEVVEEYRQPFMNDVAEKRKTEEPKPPPPPPVNENKTEEPKKKDPKIKDEVLDDETKSKIKKIFREIVKKSHPDKTGSDENLEIYISAKDAYEDNDLMELYRICGKLGISVDPEVQDMLLLEELIEMKRQEIKNLESSFIWSWIKTETQEQKDGLVDQFIKTHHQKF